MLQPRQLKSISQEVALVTSVFMAQFLSQGGVTMLISTMNIILDSFEKDSGQTIPASMKVWFMGSFSLTVGTFILISGKIGDIFGLKKVYLAGWIWVAVWSLICGFSVYTKSIVFYIVCRAFQGVGYGLLLPCGLGLLGVIYESGNRKNFVFGLVGAAGPTGATTGAIMAAVVSQLAWWPWSYWLMGIAAAIIVVVSYFGIPDLEDTNSSSSLMAKLKQFDFIGSFTGVTGLVLLNFCWNQGPAANWSAYIIVLLVASVAFLGAFFYVELYYVSNPLLPRSIFNYKIGLVLVCICFGWGSFGIWLFYFFTILLNLKNYSPIHAGLCMLPLLVMGVIAAMLCSKIIAKTRPSYIICFSCMAFMCGDIMLSVTPIDQTYWRLIFGQAFILCWGMDLSFPAASIILSDFLPPHQQGMAGSLVATVVNYSVSLFLAMGLVVESEVFKRTSDELLSIRSALRFGIGVGGLGVLFLVIFVIVQKKNNDRGTDVGALDVESTISEEIKMKGEMTEKKETP